MKLHVYVVPTNVDFAFPVEWTNAVLIVALMSICMVLTLFAYLNYRTKKPYFSLWIVSWICYAGYLAAAVGLQESPDLPFLVMMRRSCIGLSALYMFWGSFFLSGHPRSMRELQFGTVMLLIWSGVAAFLVRDRFWITMPVFALLAAAGIYTGIAYLLRRKTYHGATILGIGFLLWGAHLVAFPYMESSQILTTLGYFATAVLTIMNTIGMIVEREVTIAEQCYRVLFDSASDAIFLVDLSQHRILEANASALRLTKRSAIELVGRPLVEICPSLQSAETTSVRMDAIKLFNAVFRPFTEVSITRANGTTAHCEGDTTLVQWHQRPALQVNLRDVGDRKKVGEQLRRAEKLSALGKLIAGVAHELNNPLAVVMGYSQLMAERGSLDEEARDEVQLILHESERASRIVRDLLSFTRPTEPHKLALDVNRLIASVVETQEVNIRAGEIQLEQQLAGDLPHTMADPNQIEQVLVNLIGNAIQALGARPSPRVLTIGTEENGNYIWIIVADNGSGIPQEVIGRIFDPFFTTKPLGKGTGLGLTISNTIIQEHHGRILVENQPTGGVRFVVELPVVECVRTTAPARNRLKSEPLTQGSPKGTALVVDDEPGIVSLLKTVFSRIGYEVTTATNGQEALEQIAARSYDLIVSDMRMPGMDGVKFYETLKKQDAALARRIVFVTGDTVSPETRTFLTSTGNPWLSKPFTLEQVADTVTEALNKIVVSA